MNIKSILVSAMVLLTACCGKQDANSTAATTPEKKEITLQLYSLRDAIVADYDGTIKKVGEMGFTSVEAAGYKDGKFYGKAPAEFKADIEKAGMTILSSHVNRQLNEKELASKDLTEVMKWWDTAIQAHKEIGAKYIVEPWISIPKTLKDLQTICDYLNEIGKKCKEQGILFGYHNHAHEFEKVEDQVMFDYMIVNTNPDYVFYQMDVYWTVLGKQSPVDYFHKYPGRFTLLHIKDNREVGQSGMVGLDAIFNNTEIAGVKGIVVEVEHYSFDPVQSVKVSLDYLLNAPFVKASYSN